MNTKREKHVIWLITVAILAAILALILWLLTTTVAYTAAVTRYVASDGNCGSASPCYSTIQTAVAAAQSGDEIRVAAGTYTGVNNLGGHPQHLYLDKNLTIRGGFTPANWNTPDPHTNITELQAQTLGRVVYVEQTVTATLDGLYITYGNATGLGGHTVNLTTKDAGGGVYLYKASLTLQNCQVLHSATPAEGLGGGLYAGDSTLTIENTRFEDNTSGTGGGLHVYLGNATIQNSQFVANQASGVLNVGPFAVSVDEAALLFTGNVVEANFSEGAGSAVGLSETNFTMTQNQITGTSEGSIHNKGVSLSSSTGQFMANTVTNHPSKGVTVFAGFVDMINNEIAYNEGWPADMGAGVSYDSTGLSASQFVMTGNHIHHNIDRYGAQGGGVNINTSENSPAYLFYNLIEDNMSGDGTGVLTADGNGGGVYLSGDYVTLVGNIIRRNVANGIPAGSTTYGGKGGGVYMDGNATLINNIITDNQARYAGSGVYVIGATPNLYHNTIVHNIFEGGDGSGVYSTESYSNIPGQPRLYNNMIADQLVGIFATKEDVTSLAIVDGILWFNNGANTGGSGTIFVNHEYTGDPLFIDPVNGDFHIGSNSAAIDKGIASEILTDYDHEPRFGIPDLGADEYWAPGMLKRIYLPIVRDE